MNRKVIEEVEGERAISRLKAAGVPPFVIKFLKREMARGAELTLDIFEGAPPTFEGHVGPEPFRFPDETDRAEKLGV